MARSVEINNLILKEITKEAQISEKMLKAA